MTKRSLVLVDSEVVIDSKASIVAGDPTRPGLADRLQNLRSYLENSLRWDQQLETDAGAELSIDFGRIVRRR